MKITFLILFLILSGCSGLDKLVKSPKVDVTDVRLKSAEAKTAILEIVMKVTNPNGISVTVDKLKYDLQVNEKSVTSGVYDQKVKVPANDTVEVAVPLTVAYKDLLQTALNLITTKGAPYRAIGSVQIGPFNIPFDEKGTLKLKDL